MSLSMLLLWASVAGLAAEAPITSVTVYSDQARVTRSAQVALGGASSTLEFPLLRESVDPASVRVEARGAEVERVDLSHVEAGEAPFAPDEARALLADLEKVEDRLRLATARRQAYAEDSATLSQVSPSVRGDKERPPPPLTGKGWSEAVAFLASRQEQDRSRLAALDEELYTLRLQHEALTQKAYALGGARREGGWRVVATLRGNGRATATLTYLAPRARWFPSYDLQYLPAEARVVVAFAGLVSQETGEDWQESELTLSTAVPGHFMAMPRLTTWKIGEQERFIPTAVATSRPTPRPPPAPAPPSPEEDELEELRQRLLMAAGQAEAAAQQRAQAASRDQQRRESQERARRKSAPPPPPPPSAPPPSAPMAPGGMAAPSAAPSEDFMMEQEEYAEELVVSSPVRAMPRKRAALPTEGVGLTPPPAWRPPVYGPDLPITLAGGLNLLYEAPRKESISSGKGARRVALFSRSWPVKVERLLYPGLGTEAYLVAELENPSQEPLPGGDAHLFVGEDPAGTARLKLIAPGERFTLPLGLDKALQPVRNVALVQSEKGFIGKDELSEYAVTIEIANPYPHEVPVRVYDQVPVTDDPDLEVKLLEMKPLAIQDAPKGTLEWRLALPASGKVTLSFRYSLRRPKGYRLRQ